MYITTELHECFQGSGRTSGLNSNENGRALAIVPSFPWLARNDSNEMDEN